MLETLIRRLQQQLGGKTHSAVAVNVGRPNTHTQVVSAMTSKAKKKEKDEKLTPEELERQDGEPLPERTQMSVINTGPVVDDPIFQLPIEKV